MSVVIIETLNKVLAESYAFQLKAHNYHWNVVGRDFPQYHEFFGDLYSEVYGAVDKIAEHIRASDGIAYGSFSQFIAQSGIQDSTSVPSLQEMITTLFNDNDTLLTSLNAAFSVAQEAIDQGLMNFLADRLDTHKKHRWMLKSAMDATANETRVYVLDPKAV
jgi:starvation-inducible DNA-binding protein